MVRGHLEWRVSSGFRIHFVACSLRIPRNSPNAARRLYPRRPFNGHDVPILPCDVHAMLHWRQEEPEMRTARNRISHKHFRLDAAKIKRAQRFLKTSTETETVDRALD